MRINWPIGTSEERALSNGKIPGRWVNSNPFANWYQISPGVWNYHDGVDLNLNSPNWNADWHKSVYAIADGVVTYAGVGGGSWGHIIVIEHTDNNGQKFYSRCGHVEKTIVQTGDALIIGQPIAQVGDADGYYRGVGAHLHFNLCTTDLLKNRPNHWSGIDRKVLLANYADPVKFIAEHFDQAPQPSPAPQPPPPSSSETLYVRAPSGLRLRHEPKLSSSQIALLLYGTQVTATETQTTDGYIWRRIQSSHGEGWAAQSSVDGKTILLTKT
jgi:murein DD-endopeptidase MepM/ murein hydrolase activator NlpD